MTDLFKIATFGNFHYQLILCIILLNRLILILKQYKRLEVCRSSCCSLTICFTVQLTCISMYLSIINRCYHYGDIKLNFMLSRLLEFKSFAHDICPGCPQAWKRWKHVKLRDQLGPQLVVCVILDNNRNWQTESSKRCREATASISNGHDGNSCPSTPPCTFPKEIRTKGLVYILQLNCMAISWILLGHNWKGHWSFKECNIAYLATYKQTNQLKPLWIVSFNFCGYSSHDIYSICVIFA